MIRRASSFVLALVVTAVALWFLLTPDVVRDLQLTLTRADWRLFALAMMLSAGVQWLRALRFAIMTTGRLALPDARLIRIAFQLNFFNFVLPFRLGELSYPVLMRRDYGQSLLSAGGVLLLARLLDLSSVGAILLGAAAILDLARSVVGNALLGLAAAALALIPFATVLSGQAALRAARPRAAGPLAALGSWFDAPHSSWSRAAAIGLSFGIWLTFGALAITSAHAVLVPMRPLVALLGASASNLAFALPINGIGGLGPSQAAWAAAVNIAGIAWDDAVVSAFGLHAVVLAAALLFGGVAMLAGRTGMRAPCTVVHPSDGDKPTAS